MNARARLTALTALLGLALAARISRADDSETEKWVPISEGVTTQLVNDGKKIGYPGLTAGVAVDRTTGDLFMVVCDQGVWKSSDQGRTFARVDEGAIGGRCETGYAFDPAPAGKGLAAFMVYGGCGLSRDGGKSWIKFKSSHFDCGAVDWEAGGKTLLAIRHESGGTLAYSTDEGQSWTDLGKGFTNGVGLFDARTLVATKGRGMLRSDDAGANWIEVSDLQVVGGTMYVANNVGYWCTEKGLAITRDKGVTWSVPGAAILATHGPYFGRDEQHLVIGSPDGLFESKDGGGSWEKIAPLPEGFTIRKSGQSYANFAWDPLNNILYASTMGKPTYRWRR
ncbi:MAG TPA: hypothetical protein VFV87_01765 [Pirellulaceae bacterium]|nr:hypothetical protein [Pirellulaceae bacterium]